MRSSYALGVSAVDLARVFEASPNPYMILDRELRYVAANPAYCAVTGRRAEDLIGRRIDVEFPHDPDDPNNANQATLLASFRRVIATGTADVLPMIHYRIAINGVPEDHYWSATHTPMFDATGNVEYVLQHTVNITELRKQQLAAPGSLSEQAGVLGRAEQIVQRTQALDENLHQMLRVFDQAPNFLAFLRGPDHVFELANAAYMRLVGNRPVVGRTLREALPEVADQFSVLLDGVYRTGEPFVGTAMQVELQHQPGVMSTAIVDFVYQAILGPAGTPIGVLVSGNDITRQHRAQAEVAQLARVLDSSRDFIGICTPGGTPTFLNAAGLEMLGFASLDAAKRTPMIECFVERQRARVLDEVLPAAITSGYWEGELSFVHRRTGEEIPVLYAVFPLRDPSGGVAALATITRDLRPHKTRELERAKLLEAEQAARAQAEQANRSKDQFLAIVSHELRTPLTAILGWMQMLRGGMLTGDKRERALETVERNARIQAQLIDDLLDVSRIISGKLALELESVDIASVVAAAVDTVRPSADAKQIRLDLVIEATAPLIGDTRRLQQVVWNLLANAVKFTPREGSIELRVDRFEDWLEIAVSDTGAGIRPEFLPYVFDRFRQADDDGTTRATTGLGLGLSIVRHVVEAHAGTVRAFSTGVGQGARFVVRLPVAIAKTSLHDTSRPQAFEPPPVLAGRHVLVVEDEADTRDYLMTLLTSCGLRVTTAANAQEAFDAIARDRPDLLISDLGLPGEDGFSLIKRVRQLPTVQGGLTPAVALTAFARSEDRTRAILSGFHNHIAKPIDPAELLAVLGALATRGG